MKPGGGNRDCFLFIPRRGSRGTSCSTNSLSSRCLLLNVMVNTSVVPKNDEWGRPKGNFSQFSSVDVFPVPRSRRERDGKSPLLFCETNVMMR